MSFLFEQFESLVMECPDSRYSAFDQHCRDEALEPGYETIQNYHLPHLPFLRKYPEWYAGSSRIAYVDHDKGVVYKVPTTKRGMRDNIRDASLYEKQREGRGNKNRPIARCVLLHDFVLEMELVTPLKQWEAPDNFLESDGFQIGETKDGKIVFFDL